MFIRQKVASKNMAKTLILKISVSYLLRKV